MAHSGTVQPKPRISGQIIINELIRNMELGRLELGYSILVPCLFSVYLHPDDYTRVASVQDIIKEDAERAAQNVSDRHEYLVDRAVRGQRIDRAAGGCRDPFGAERSGGAGIPWDE